MRYNPADVSEHGKFYLRLFKRFGKMLARGNLVCIFRHVLMCCYVGPFTDISGVVGSSKKATHPTHLHILNPTTLFIMAQKCTQLKKINTFLSVNGKNKPVLCGFFHCFCISVCGTAFYWTSFFALQVSHFSLFVAQHRIPALPLVLFIKPSLLCIALRSADELNE